MLSENRIKNQLTQEEIAEKLDITWHHSQRLKYNEEASPTALTYNIVLLYNTKKLETFKVSNF